MSETVARRTHEAALERIEELEAIVALRDAEARVAGGRDEYVPLEVAERLWADESPVRVWREHRGLTLTDLAGRAATATGYLSEIETGRKPGSLATMARIARALAVSLDDLAPSA